MRRDLSAPQTSSTAAASARHTMTIAASRAAHVAHGHQTGRARQQASSQHMFRICTTQRGDFWAPVVVLDAQ